MTFFLPVIGVVDVFGHQADERADSIVSSFELQDKFSVD